MVYLPPDLVTKIRSCEWGVSVRAIIMTFLEIPLLIRMRSPSRIATRLSFLLLALIDPNYHRLFFQAIIASSKNQVLSEVGSSARPTRLTISHPSDSSPKSRCALFEYEYRRSRPLRPAGQFASRQRDRQAPWPAAG